MGQQERLSELQRFAARQEARANYRGSVIRALASHLDDGEPLLAIAATTPAGSSAVVLVTALRILVAYQPAVRAGVTVTVLARSEVTASEATSSGNLCLTTQAGTVEVGPFAGADLEHLDLAIALPRPLDGGSKRVRRWARPITDLQLIGVLHDAGVLTTEEHDSLRQRLLLRIAARSTDD